MSGVKAATGNYKLHDFAVASGSELISSLKCPSKAENIRQAVLDLQIRLGWATGQNRARALSRKANDLARM